MHVIEQAFGKNCDLYKDVLACPRDADQARLRKAYYRRALQYHPDKQTGGEAQLKFQAISEAYQLLQNADSRQVYDETGEIPSYNDEDINETGMEQWKDYFDQIFGKVTVSDIESFSSKYKCSDEERRDVLSEFRKRKGNLVKMLGFVMLSEPRDAQRWVEDYLRPAMDDGGELASIQQSYRDTMEKTLEQLKKKIEKENRKQQASNDSDDEETESEDDLPTVIRLKSKNKPSTKVSPKKAKATKTKRKKPNAGGDMTDLIAQIQNKKRGGAGLLSSLGARYGVSMDEKDDDPLNDEEFAKIQSRLGGSKKKR